MNILFFHNINESHKDLGGKAYNLGILSSQGFNVPAGLVVRTENLTTEDWKLIEQWWSENQNCPLAVRSSASDEDDSNCSFAGQNSSYLNIMTHDELKLSISNCFNSINKDSSKKYREHFLNESQARMNVVIQKMISPKFAGVYFSSDPRGKTHGDLIEYSEGLGEDLVSGKITPFKIDINTINKEHHPDWMCEYTKNVRTLGKNVKHFLKIEVDIEWAIDQNGELFLLQARPITALYSESKKKIIIEEELERIKNNYSKNTIWDGHTFSEWTGIPSYLSYSLMKNSFAPNYAFSDALKTLGYMSFVENEFSPHQSIVNRIYGRVYINLSQMCPLYFGPIPYDLDPLPRPHLKFNWKKIDFETIMRTPLSIYNMIKVGWDLTSKRNQWLDQCSKELVKFNKKMERPQNHTIYQNWDGKSLIERFSKETFLYSKYTQHWPFVLIILTESTMHSLEAILKSVMSDEKAKSTLQYWMGHGLHTATYDMNRYFKKACHDEKKQDFFMSKYGHRGAGELDLKNPRWCELGSKAFYKLTDEEISEKEDQDVCDIENEIMAMQTFKKTIILEQWKLLKRMLELREKWKMAMLKPFAHIRYIALELGKRAKIDQDIFDLSIEEIIEFKVGHDKRFHEDYLSIIKKRKEENNIYKLYSLPDVLNVNIIDEVISGKYDNTESFSGESLSPGLSYGTVKVVRDINNIDLNNLPEDLILVAETTDPGWTPIFTKAKGIIVEKGGILSHSAIVAREMGIPAISGIKNSVNQFKDGERIRLDGNNGHITYELQH